METYQQVIVMRAVTDPKRGATDRRDRRRELTAEQIDALADYEWPWDGLKRVVIAITAAIVPPSRRSAVGPANIASLAPAETS